MKYIDAEKLKAEIEQQQRKLNVLSLKGDNIQKKDAAVQNGAYVHILSIIDSLQQEQQEVDLEKDFSEAWAIYPIPRDFVQDLLEERGLLEFIYKTARHFYELGKNSK